MIHILKHNLSYELNLSGWNFYKAIFNDIFSILVSPTRKMYESKNGADWCMFHNLVPFKFLQIIYRNRNIANVLALL